MCKTLDQPRTGSGCIATERHADAQGRSLSASRRFERGASVARAAERAELEALPAQVIGRLGEVSRAAPGHSGRESGRRYQQAMSGRR
jgi:hypothetical protein